MTTRQQIESFYDFAKSQTENGGSELSMDEIYGLWRAKNPTPTELAESVNAVRAAYAEIEAGDDGRPAREALRESCERLGLLIDE